MQADKETQTSEAKTERRKQVTSVISRNKQFLSNIHKLGKEMPLLRKTAYSHSRDRM